ncbi:MAG: helicase-related protein, partial [Pseudomonadota bacterium]
KSEQTEIKEKLAEQTSFVCIGTHALFQKDTLFGNLGLIIIDEQHRFGVEQRRALLEKGRTDHYLPHQLIMTATPIPRTLAMTAYAELDTSVIDELPPNRQTVETVAISIDRRIDLIKRIEAACNDSRQVYWVCTLIEESDVLDCQPAIDAHKDLQAKLTEQNIGLVHGRMKADEKEAVMRDFKAGNIHVLVATTVIEVGVDVPNASLMIIENAERLGLSQLHQLRGRVGRGSIKSDCVLLYRTPLSDHAKARIDTMRKTNDGFTIAEKDLQLRGPGEVLGTRQTGVAEMQIADVIRDADLISDVEEVAEQLLVEYPERVDSIIQRWLGKNIEYSIV